MATDGTEAYPSREDRIVAEFGDGYDVKDIAARYGLTVAQVYAVVEREVGPVGFGYPGLPNQYQPPGYYAPPPAHGYHPPPPPVQGYYPPPPPPVQGHHPSPPPPTHGYYPPPPPTHGYYPPPPPAAYVPPGHPGQDQDFPPPPGFQDYDAIVAEYGEGHDVESIARRHGISAEQVYEVVQRMLGH